MTAATSLSLDLHSLAAAYAGGTTAPADVAREVLRRIAAAGDDKVWISRVPDQALLEAAERLNAVPPDRRAALPLYGVPFAVKDNIDVAGMATTAACPAFAYTAKRSATVVDRLVAAGALLVGKTNLDQFATGLVGTRSPYGAARNPFDPRYIPGGSSSGSAVAVAAGLVGFALGTDTAGSGRVPAGFNNIVGLKPTKGAISTRGAVPACRTLDCISVFALTAADAARVFAVAGAFDADDPYARRAPHPEPLGAVFRFGVPDARHLDFMGDQAASAAFGQAIERLTRLGGAPVEVDFAPFAEAAALLYDGAWVAERLAAIQEFAAAQPEAMHPVTGKIILGGTRFSAVDAFRGEYRLRELARRAERTWSAIDLLLVPTSPTIFTLAQVEAEPIMLNTALGRYTNFVNLLDLCAVAVPNAMRPDGLPIGATLIASAWSEATLLDLAGRFHALTGLPLGATGQRLPNATPPPEAHAEGAIPLAVFGAHLVGQPLNHQLTSIGARLVRACRTAPTYRMFALSDPPRPGLIRVARDGGAVAGEIWAVPAAKLGGFVAGIKAPLGVGRVRLDDGQDVLGFTCESEGVAGCPDITAHGDWRAYLNAAIKRPAE